MNIVYDSGEGDIKVIVEIFPSPYWFPRPGKPRWSLIVYYRTPYDGVPTHNGYADYWHAYERDDGANTLRSAIRKAYGIGGDLFFDLCRKKTNGEVVLSDEDIARWHES